MGRHRRSALGTAADPAAAGRHRGPHRSPLAPVRTGLLGVSAAVAVGAVAMASGLTPGGGYKPGGGNDSAGQVQAGGPPDSGLETQGSQSAAPTGRGSTPADRGDDRPHAPSTTPSKPSHTPSTPSGTPSATPGQPGSSGSSGNGRPGGNGEDGSTGGGPGKPSRTPVTEPTAPAPPAASAGPETASEAEVLSLVNQEREKVGCAPVTADPKLAQLAEDFSQDMSLRQFFDHIDPDGDSPWDRAESAGILDLGGENIARGQSDAQAVMDSWMHSSGHRANILNCSFKRMGVGAHFGDGGPWWTQDFGY
ncbi:CAP domain-containing protein [Streptomyces hygroscopicus]|uniref:CAP domain-containing protein n=1 Tax=Streptomyces hygroscopicus TaxID=1912 RepID=UPI00082FA29C|nr:CAP domain-containing protein [Streptomyces hygroscopicus]GLV77609.1 membrane protein [Streptomyces hygroscopicus subsp. hygroscopicus]